MYHLYIRAYPCCAGKNRDTTDRKKQTARLACDNITRRHKFIRAGALVGGGRPFFLPLDRKTAPDIGTGLIIIIVI